ncbi:hypothetical protein [Latilactobacillus sakei]|uniref:Uncharacterized protein n=1 Tax=Latilactobacillus sakei TaxID=1599 RepID=A0AAF0GQM3_LATSK|nr:hypothetical protein [Latilactobacillus sakei]WGI19296.1 hypothetical protein QBD03_00695 [Latilactobacillus sakei]
MNFIKKYKKQSKKAFILLKWITILLIIGVVIAILIITTPILFNLLSNIKLNKISDGALGFWGGIFGSSIGVFGSYLVMNYQIKVTKRHERLVKKPILALGSVNYKELNIQSYKKGRFYIDSIEKWLLKVPVINAGVTPILNIEMTYSFSENELSKLSELSDPINSLRKNTFFMTKRNKSILHFSNDRNAYELASFDSFTTLSSTSEIDRVPVIMPGKTELMILPSSFSNLIRFYVRQTNERKKNQAVCQIHQFN